MEQPNTPLPSAFLSSFLPGSSYPYPTPHQIINPTSIPQNLLKHPHRLERLHSQTPLHYQQQTTSGSQQVAQYKQFAQERSEQSAEARRAKRADLPPAPRSVLGSKSQTGSTASLTASRPARSYIRSWRREVGEAASGNVEEDVTVGNAPIAPTLKQRDSEFSISEQTVVAKNAEEEEHTRDVQQDVPLNTFSRAVDKLSGKQGERVDAVRQETIKQERVIEQNQTKQQSQEQKKALAEKMVGE